MYWRDHKKLLTEMYPEISRYPPRGAKWSSEWLSAARPRPIVPSSWTSHWCLDLNDLDACSSSQQASEPGKFSEYHTGGLMFCQKPNAHTRCVVIVGRGWTTTRLALSFISPRSCLPVVAVYFLDISLRRCSSTFLRLLFRHHLAVCTILLQISPPVSRL